MNTKRNIISKKQTTTAVWEGEKQQRTRISRYWNKDSVLAADFEKVLFEMMHAETIYINTNEHYRAAVETETRSLLCKMVERQISNILSQKATQFYNAFVL
jgi:hypothetical protein